MSRKSLQLDVYVTPLIPVETGSTDPPKRLWQPTVVTVIHSEEHALIVDTPPTVPETEKFLAWLDTIIPGKQVLYTFTTHAHGDHAFGLSVIRAKYPSIKTLATPRVRDGIVEHFFGPGMLYDTLWTPLLPNGQSPAKKDLVVPDALEGPNLEFELDGFKLRAYDVPHGDCAHNSFLHVPSLRAVVAGDIVYALDCHQYYGESSTKEARRGWMAVLEQIEALGPHVVIPGHARASQVFGAHLIESTRRYGRIFEEELEKVESAHELEGRMMELYPERSNFFILEITCQEAFAGKGS